MPTVSDVFHLGSPHRGAPLERVAAAASAALRRLPETAPFGRLLDTRSAGVKDLRHGAIVEPDWAGVDVDRDRRDHGTDVPLLPTARHHFVAATLTRRGEGRAAELVGDVLVPPSSATGQGAEAVRTPFPPEVGTARRTSAPPRPARPPRGLRPAARGAHAIVSRIPVMSAIVVRGLTIANRVTVSPSCDVGVTKA